METREQQLNQLVANVLEMKKESLYVGSIWHYKTELSEADNVLYSEPNINYKVVSFNDNQVITNYVYGSQVPTENRKEKTITFSMEEFLNDLVILTYNKYVKMNIVKVDIEKYGRLTDKHNFIHNNGKYFIARLNDETFNPLSTLYTDIKYWFQNGYSNGTYLTFKSFNDKLHNYLSNKHNYIICEYYSNNENLTVINQENVITIKSKVIKENVRYPRLKLNDIVEVKYKVYTEDKIIWKPNFSLYLKHYYKMKDNNINVKDISSTNIVAPKGSLIGGSLYVKCADETVIDYVKFDLKEYLEKV